MVVPLLLVARYPLWWCDVHDDGDDPVDDIGNHGTQDGGENDDDADNTMMLLLLMMIPMTMMMTDRRE